MRSPFELQSLIAWLEKQPANRVYDYTNPFACMSCQYLRAARLPVYSVGPSEMQDDFPGGFWQDTDFEIYSLPKVFDDISYAEPRTFGAALSRAKALL